MDKKISRHSHVELIDVIRNGRDEAKIRAAKAEFTSRNLPSEEIKKVEAEYLMFKKFQLERKNKPLSNLEWLNFFFTTSSYRFHIKDNHFTESEMERFEKHGFEKKMLQAEKAMTFGYFFRTLLILFAVLILIILAMFR